MTIHDVSVPPAPAGIPAILAPSEAYAQTLPAIEKQKEEELLSITTDIPTMASRLVACQAAIEPLIPEATARLRDFDATLFTSIGARAMALLHAHTLHVTAEAPVADDPIALGEAADVLRAFLLDGAQYLARNGFIDPRRLERFRNQPGYRTQATDLMGLEQVLRSAGPDVLARCAVRAADLDKAATIASRLFAIVARREQSQTTTARTALIRQKAYTLVVNEYDTIRSIVGFLRWKQDDADDFAPSLFGGRRTGRRDQARADAPDRKDATAAEPTKPADHAAVAPAAPGSAHVAGQPGGSPFLS